jgi:uncharacterized membrane protein
MYIEYQRRDLSMSSALLILLARAVHILGGVTWAGSVFVMTSAILPFAARQGNEGFGQWVRPIGRKVGPAAGIAAILTILSGIYMMAVLHPQDRSVGGIVLISGATAALLSFVSGFFTRGSAVGARITAALLGLAVLAMAVFRYAAAIG